METSRGAMLVTTAPLDDGGFITVSADITELKQSNEALQRLSSAMQKVPNGILMCKALPPILKGIIYISASLGAAWLLYW